jgi:hypothetical protein
LFPTGMIFMKLGIWKIFENLSRKFKRRKTGPT